MSAASLSPVAKYIICEFEGSIAISETPITAKSSVLVDQLTPPLIDFQSPPSGAPTYIILLSLGSKRIKFNLPAPPPDGFPTGPTIVQLPLIVFGITEFIFSDFQSL